MDKKDRGNRDPFKGMNVVEAMIGADHRPVISGTPTDADIIIEEERKRRERRAKLRSLKPWQRRKYQRDAKRSRWTLRLPRRVVDAVQSVADEYHAPPASALSWLLAVALREVGNGNGVVPDLESSRDLHNAYRVKLPDEWEDERVKVSYDVDDTLKRRIGLLQAAYDCSLWSLVAWLVSIGMALHEAGEEPRRTPSTNLRYDFVLSPKPAGKRRGHLPDDVSENVVSRFGRVLGNGPEEV